ncbi:MAG TPA: plastocyanin/azurin family copper-binding protein [Solirubrobacterales bacterium]
MSLRPIAVGLAVAGLTSFGAFATGCGSDDETSSTAAAASDEASGESNEATEEGSATTSAPAAGGETLTIEMGEFYYKPDAVEAKAGTVTIDAPNAGSAPHELVLAKTGDDPARLPTGSDGSVDEEALDVPGEISEVAGGADGTVTLDLDAGKYVIFCNLPGHYSSGMYGSLTVK